MFDAIDSFLRASANNCFGCRDDLDGNIGVIAVEGRPAAKYIRLEYHAHGATLEDEKAAPKSSPSTEAPPELDRGDNPENY